MRQAGTITLSQKELNRVAVITQCVKGTTSVRHAAALLQLSARQVKRLKRRFRSGGAAALAHAGRARASPRRAPAPVRQRILRLARTTYAGFNDHHLTEKLREVEGIRMGRETLRQFAARRRDRPAAQTPPTRASPAACAPRAGGRDAAGRRQSASCGHQE